MRISPEVEIALTLAQNEAARRRHEYFTLEHLLYALLFDEPTAQIIRHALHLLAEIGRMQVHDDLPALQPGDGEQILDQEREPVRVLLNRPQKARGLFRIVLRALQQRLDKPFDQ
jgi:ATP-dependent Clp protease ATP-binding subunit ClpA